MDSNLVKYDFTNDLVFKASLEDCPKALLMLLKVFVPDFKYVDINQEVTYLNKENIYNVSISTTIFDVNVQMANSLVEFEMQRTKPNYKIENRMLKYIADLINNSFDKELKYEHKSCHSVWFLGFKLFDDSSCVHQFEFYDKDHNISLVNDTKVTVIEFAKFTENDYNGNRWYRLFKTNDINILKGDDEVMNELAESIKNLNNDEEFVLKIDARERAMREYNAQMAGAQEIGMQQGMQKGLEEGMQKGERNKAIEVAKNLKAMGLSLEQIAKATGLSKEEIESL